MGAATRDLAGLGWTLLVSLGPLLLLIGLLNRRDRRRGTLLGIVSGQISSAALRSDVAVEVHPSLRTWRDRVVVRFGPCTRDEAWAAIARLRRALPPSVRLTVDGYLDRCLPARLTIEAIRERVGEAVGRKGAESASEVPLRPAA